MNEKAFYAVLKHVVIGPWLKLVFRPRWQGVENVPTDGPAILASNHLSYSDWLFMPLGLPRMVRFVAKDEYFVQPGIKGWFKKTFFAGTGNVPIDRSGASAAEGALIAAQRVLGEGELFGIYPEGTRSHDGKLYRGRTGVARLALETKAPVIPVAVIGTDVIAPPGKAFGKLVRLHREGRPDLTQEKLGRLVGLSRTSITNIEQGRQRAESQHQHDAGKDTVGCAGGRMGGGYGRGSGHPPRYPAPGGAAMLKTTADCLKSRQGAARPRAGWKRNGTADPDPRALSVAAQPGPATSAHSSETASKPPLLIRLVLAASGN